VSLALAKAYGGQTTALSRLGAGLSKATLASGDLDLITAELTKKFSGQALAAAEGYAGSMAKLAVASENAKEIIGKDLLDAMQLIAGKDGIGGATTAMEGFATQVGNAIYGVGVLISKLREIPGAGVISDFLTAPTGALALLSMFGRNRKTTAAGTPAQSPGQRKAIDKANSDALKLQKSKNELAKIDNANTTRKIVLTADQQALEELKKKFDVERIGLFAALNSATDQETQMRIKSLIAIHDNDTALAGKIKAEDEAAKQALLLAASMQAAALQISYSAGLASFKQSEIDSLKTGPTVTPLAKAPTPMPSSPLESFRQNEARYASNSAPTYIINAQGIGDQQIAAVVQGAIQDLNRYGSSTTYAGAI
jgi:hypothetical protein